MAETESRRVNTLVLQHLYKVAPHIAGVFERTHPCEESEICNSLSQIVAYYKTAELAKSLVYKYLNQNYPELDPYFKLENMAGDLSLEAVVENYDNNHVTTSRKRKIEELPSRRVKIKTDSVLEEQDFIDSEFFSELEKYYPCTYSSESSSDSEVCEKGPHSEAKGQTKPVENKTKTKPVDNKTKQASVNKSFENIKKDDIVGFCRILDCDVYKNLQNKVGDSKPLDILASFILKENIPVRKIHQLIITTSPTTVSMVLSTSIGTMRQADVKVGRYNPEEFNLIENNWKKLVTSCDLGDPYQVFKDILEVPSSRKGNEDALKQNVIALFLSLGMTNVRYASDVFGQARRIFIRKRKKYQKLTPEEKLVMTEYVEKHGENCDWKELGYILFNHYDRHPSDIKKWYDQLKNKCKCGPFSLLEDKLIVDKIISDSEAHLGDPNFRENEMSFESLEKKLGRRKNLIRYHWQRILRPHLLQFHAGTLHLDIRGVFFNYLSEKNVTCLQDIEWHELLEKAIFAGQTKPCLIQLFNSVKGHVAQARNWNRSEVTVSMMTEYVNERQNPKNKRNIILSGKKEKRKTELINHYKTLINKITS